MNLNAKAYIHNFNKYIYYYIEYMCILNINKDTILFKPCLIKIDIITYC